MYKHLIFTPTKGMSTEEWLKRRKIGGSDILSLFRKNHFKPEIKLFHEKIGTYPEYQTENLATYGGKCQEDLVERFYWRFWDPTEPTPEKMLENAFTGNQVRKCRRLNAIVENPDYPWLTFNVDRIINKNQFGKQGEGVLEIKTGLSFAAKKYEGGINPGYILQQQAYLLGLGLDYSELMHLQDGRFPEWWEFEKNETIQNAILEKSEAFWRLVEEGRAIMASDLSQEEKNAAIAEIEPDPEGTSACEDYLKERYRISENPMPLQGTDEQLKWAAEYLRCTEKIKETEKVKSENGNKLRQLFINNETDTIEWGNIGLASWKKNAKGTPTLNVQSKILKTAEELELI